MRNYDSAEKLDKTDDYTGENHLTQDYEDERVRSKIVNVIAPTGSAALDAQPIKVVKTFDQAPGSPKQLVRMSSSGSRGIGA